MMTREEAIEYFKMKVSAREAIGNDIGTDYEAYKIALTALRPVSREQVILCKDCQYWQGNNGGYPHPECRWGNDETPDEDDYCSFAERLEALHGEKESD